MKIKRVSDSVVRNFKMRLCHVSDTHGGFPRLFGKYDAVLHTGDLFPDSKFMTLPDKSMAMSFQLRWLEDNIQSFKTQLQGHPFLFVPGNHDYITPDLVEQILNTNGIRAFNLTDKLVTFEGVNFYGFPYVPEIGGNIFAYERAEPEMKQEVDKMVSVLNTSFVEVVAAHSALSNCLDLAVGNRHLGSTIISNGLNYDVVEACRPTHYLHGHIHDAHGIAMRNGMLISNAAVTYHILEI